MIYKPMLRVRLEKMTRYNSLNIWIVSEFSDIEDFKKKKHYMKSVDESFILEAIRGIDLIPL